MAGGVVLALAPVGFVPMLVASCRIVPPRLSSLAACASFAAGKPLAARRAARKGGAR